MSNAVFCHSGFRYSERPVSFHFGGRFNHIQAVLAEWKTVNGYLFSVLTDLDQQYQLIYDEHHDAWKIIPPKY